LVLTIVASLILTMLHLRSCVRFATWNVLTLNGTGYEVALIHELEKYNIAIAGI